MPNESEEQSTYNELSEISPEREIDDEEDVQTHQTLSERIAETRNPSDIEIALKELFADLGIDYLNVIQKARIFPDTFNHLFNILVKEVMRNDRTMTLGKATALVETALTIAIDGEGRIELLGVVGALKKANEEEKLKTLGV